MLIRHLVGIISVDVLTVHTIAGQFDVVTAEEADATPDVSSLLQVAMQTVQKSDESSQEEGQSSAACTAESLSSKDLDLVIFGAYGFTGSLSAEYLGQGHPENPQWAIAGRKEDELKALFDTLPNKPQASIVADLDNATSLDALTARTKVVLTYAGPYEHYGGEALIKSAIEGCAHYVDITGENHWKKSMMSKYGKLAKERGVSIVQSAGFDSMPADLMGMLAAESFASARNEPPDGVLAVFTKKNGWMSGGTKASGVYSTAAHGLATLDPYFLLPESAPECHVDTSPDGMEGFGYDPHLQATLRQASSGSIDGPVLRRSLRVRFPSSCIHAGVCQTAEVETSGAEFFADPRMLTDPPPSPLTMLPGDGPPRWMQEDGSFALHGVARGDSTPNQSCATLNVMGDPGYFATARMSTELALGLALDSPQRGYQTPSLALGAKNLKARLEKVLHLDGGKAFTFGETCPFEQ